MQTTHLFGHKSRGRSQKKSYIVVTAGFLLAVVFPQQATNSQKPLPRTSNSVTAGAVAGAPKFSEVYGNIPLGFEANEGQADKQIKYLAQGSGYGIFLTRDQAIFALRGQAERQAAPSPKEAPGRPMTKRRLIKPPATLKMKIVGAGRTATVEGVNPLPSKSNYFIGNDPTRWRSNIPHYAKVQYKNIYPGIDLVYYGNQRQLEYDFVVSPGADASRIEISFDGAKHIHVDGNGDLALHTASGELRQRKPVIYQDSDGLRQRIEGRYVMRGDRRVGFEIESHDRSKPLVIDPVLVYSTYLGGSDRDFGNAVKADTSGEVYVTGVTYSPDFPAKGQLQFGLLGLGNAFVSKLDPAGSLVYSTYLGGEGEDVGFAITIDSTGAAYVAGSTSSRNFPTTPGAAQSSPRGRIDGVVTKLNPSGSAIVYSTYLGGQSDDLANSIAIDSSRQVYITGETTSIDFPTTNAFQSILKGRSDVFATKLNSAGSAFIYW